MYAIKEEQQSNVIDIGNRTRQRLSQKKVQKLKTISEENIPSIKREALGAEDVTKLLMYFVSKSRYDIVTALVFGFNTGYRAGDLLALTYDDVMQDGKIVSALRIVEQKTGKTRTVYLNEAVQKVLYFLHKYTGANIEDYIFTPLKGAKMYVAYLPDKDGNILPTPTHDKYDMFGNKNRVCPMKVGTLNDGIVDAVKKLGLIGTYGSHSMRVTFANEFGKNWEDDINVSVVQKALAHTNKSTTFNHYIDVNEAQMKEKWLALNIGLDVVDFIIENSYIEMGDFTVTR